MLSPFRHGVGYAIFIFLLVAVTFVPFLKEPYFTRLATTFLIYSIVALSLDLLVGYGGLVSFGHAAFFGIGAYTVALLGVEGVRDATVTLPAAVLAGATGAALIGAFSLRTSGAYFIMITLAFAQMIYYGSIAATKLGGDDGIRVLRNTLFGRADLADPVAFFYAVLILFVLAYCFCQRLVWSRFGRALRAIKDNEQRVGSVGYNPYIYKLTAFSLAGGLAGLAGALNANLIEYAAPDSLHWIMSGDFLVMIILGGVGTLTGPVLGVALFLLLRESISTYSSLWMLFMGPLLLLVVLFSRGGIYELLNRAGGRRG